MPLLEEAKHQGPAAPLVLCSIRDILVDRGAEREEFDNRASNIANRYFDAVLAHSRPTFAKLEESFNPRVPLRIPIHYTGFVVSDGKARSQMSA
ncbi:MAG: hypothetical protein M3124_00450 [Actinomycetota bacterium]|nr:hypothetical protein [Actinomycetota bacterium]